MRNQNRENAAIAAADFIRTKCPEFNSDACPIGLILGTGWGDVLKIDNPQEIPLINIPGFSNLEVLEGHKRCLIIGQVAGKQVLVLSGRIHMNEAPCDPNLAKMVRLQVEMLFQLGVKQMIVTSAVGSLLHGLEIGDIGVVQGFVTVFAPEMPLWAGEFCSPEDTLDKKMQAIAHQESGELRTHTVGHVMVRGPFFEGRIYDKPLLYNSGAQVVGMSMLPEACIAALYDVDFLGLGFITNNFSDVHSHEDNMFRAKKASAELGAYLTRIVKDL